MLFRQYFSSIRLVPSLNVPLSCLTMNDSDSDSSDDGRMERESKRKRMRKALALLAVATAALSTDEEPISSSSTNAGSATRSGRSPKLLVMDETGNYIEMTPMLSPWYRTYVENPRPSDVNFLKKFRLRFRVPFAVFTQLLDMVRSRENIVYFGRWTGGTLRQKACPSVPVELLLLGGLRYIGRGWTFDDLEENTGIDQEVHRVFFHQLIKWGSTDLYDKYVVLPSTSEDARSTEYERAGMNGGIGSMDATNVSAEKINHDLKNEHIGYKQKVTARTYNIVVNNRRYILCTTHGHPARWNDKTLVKYDRLATTLRYGKSPELDNFRFKLAEKGADGTVHEVEYRGAWLIVDNGYLNWSCTIAPFKTTTTVAELRFSEWIESLRKDVECTFGILKGRFRILKSGIRLHGVEAVDKVWKTCCALHNLLLEFDGRLNDEEWLATDGEFDPQETVGIEDSMPFAMQRLNSPGSLRSYDSSRMGRGNDRDTSVDSNDENTEDNNEDEDENRTRNSEEIKEHIEKAKDENGIIRVRLLPMTVFRSKLVEHFEIMFQNNQLHWPMINKN